jgi:hypothetical protein
MSLGKLLLRSAKTAAIATITITAAIMLVSKRETGSQWAAINDICHMADGDEKDQPVEFAPRETPLGLGLNASAIATWALGYEYFLGGVPLPSSAFWAALATTGIWIVDYRIVPKRYTPGFEKHLSPAAIAAVYATLAATLALSPLWNRTDGNSSGGSGEPR